MPSARKAPVTKLESDEELTKFVADNPNVVVGFFAAPEGLITIKFDINFVQVTFMNNSPHMSSLLISLLLLPSLKCWETNTNTMKYLQLCSTIMANLLSTRLKMVLMNKNSILG